ncbi:MAG: hypothetical protein L0Z51_08225 [Candidatus Latescibacteria bacterium]|nr:hypothetical protein [Candidatus Latescibacterota bacterium]
MDSFDGSTSPTPSVTSTAWAFTTAEAACSGQAGTGAPRLGLTVDFEPLTTGEHLRSLQFDLTIPETYSNGTPVLEGDLGSIMVTLGGVWSGDSANDPPVWPLNYPLILTQPLSLSRHVDADRGDDSGGGARNFGEELPT